VTYAPERLWEEVAYVGYYLHWQMNDILDMEHPVRGTMIAEIGKINSKLNEG
jgi:hypothetical protein